MNDELRKDIDRLQGGKTKALKVRYQELFDEESRSYNHAHLFRSIASRLQALSEGDLSQRARDRARALAVDVDIRLRAPDIQEELLFLPKTIDGTDRFLEKSLRQVARSVDWERQRKQFRPSENKYINSANGLIATLGLESRQLGWTI
jgi:hypothetical protein